MIREKKNYKKNKKKQRTAYSRQNSLNARLCRRKRIRKTDGIQVPDRTLGRVEGPDHGDG